MGAVLQCPQRVEIQAPQGLDSKTCGSSCDVSFKPSMLGLELVGLSVCQPSQFPGVEIFTCWGLDFSGAEKKGEALSLAFLGIFLKFSEKNSRNLLTADEHACLQWRRTIHNFCTFLIYKMWSNFPAFHVSQCLEFAKILDEFIWLTIIRWRLSCELRMPMILRWSRATRYWSCYFHDQLVWDGQYKWTNLV